MGALSKRDAELKARGATVLGISVDKPGTSKNFRAKQNLAMPLLHDPQAGVADQYGVKMLEMPLAIPSVFVIDKNRQIIWKHVGENVPDRPTVDAILEALDSSAKSPPG